MRLSREGWRLVAIVMTLLAILAVGVSSYNYERAKKFERELKELRDTLGARR